MILIFFSLFVLSNSIVWLKVRFLPFIDDFSSYTGYPNNELMARKELFCKSWHIKYFHQQLG
jgi:hypothetical protein